MGLRVWTPVPVASGFGPAGVGVFEKHCKKSSTEMAKQKQELGKGREVQTPQKERGWGCRENHRLAVVGGQEKIEARHVLAPQCKSLALLGRGAKKKEKAVCESLSASQMVFFVPPGPRRCRAFARGRVLRVVAAGKFVALHRGASRVKLLRDIHVVPIDHVWIS